MIHQAILLLGGNISNTRHYFSEICIQLEKNGIKINGRSSLFSSPPWGFEAKQDFLNQALLIEFYGNEDKLLELILRIEHSTGRVRNNLKPGYESRIIDIDILSFGDMVKQERHLILPHPKLQERKFALLPMKEISPDWIHPVSGKKIDELISECRDNAEVKIVLA